MKARDEGPVRARSAAIGLDPQGRTSGVVLNEGRTKLKAGIGGVFLPIAHTEQGVSVGGLTREMLECAKVFHAPPIGMLEAIQRILDEAEGGHDD